MNPRPELPIELKHSSSHTLRRSGNTNITRRRLRRIAPAHVEEAERRPSGPMVNCFFEPDDIQTQSPSSLVDENNRPGDRASVFVNMQMVEEYEPYDNRVIDRPTTNTMTLLQLLRDSLGIGILAMPKAFSNAGYAVGSIGTVIMGVLCTYCVHLVLQSSYVLCKRRNQPSMTYLEALQAALSEGPGRCKACVPYAANVMKSILLINQIGKCCTYVIFMTANIRDLLEKKFMIDVTGFQVSLCILIPLIMINCVRDVKYLEKLSVITTLVTIVSFAIISYYIFRQTITFEGKVPVGEFVNFPLFFGTVLFSVEATGILPLENQMQNPRDFTGKFGILNRAMFSIIVLYVSMGLFGYLQYGDHALGSITLNLPSETEFAAAFVQGLLVFDVYVTYALDFNVAIDIILWFDCISNRLHQAKFPLVWEYLLRTVIIILIVGMAAAVPYLDLVISFFGAFCLSALGLVFPAIIETSTYWYYVSPSELIKMIVKNVIVVLIGVHGLCLGMYTSSDGIYDKYSQFYSNQSDIFNDTMDKYHVSAKDIFCSDTA